MNPTRLYFCVLRVCSAKSSLLVPRGISACEIFKFAVKMSFFKLFLNTTTVDAGTFEVKSLEFKTSQSFGYIIEISELLYVLYIWFVLSVSSSSAGVPKHPVRLNSVMREIAISFFIIFRLDSEVKCGMYYSFNNEIWKFNCKSGKNSYDVCVIFNLGL